MFFTFLVAIRGAMKFRPGYGDTWDGDMNPVYHEDLGSQRVLDFLHNHTIELGQVSRG